VKITRQAFAELFEAHVPEWLPSAWVKGTQYLFVDGSAEIDELERLYGGVCSL
jgi:prepilin-type processing-associated H-X9-DG protein